MAQMAAARGGGCLLPLALLLLALAAPSQQTRLRAILQQMEPAGSGTVAAAGAGARRRLQAAGRFVPTRIEFEDHDLYYQVPDSPRGLVILLHKCGRTGSDFWPWSKECSNCMGLPQSLAKTKQALAMGYAVAALSSKDRDPEFRCFEWKKDSYAVAAAAEQLPDMLGLPEGAPVYLDGASSGGSVALRVPGIVNVTVDGVIGEVIGPPDLPALVAEMTAQGRAMPPAVFIHMPMDEGMSPKVAAGIAALKNASTPVAEIQVFPRPVGESYFSDCSTYISPALSSRLVAELRRGGYLDAQGMVVAELNSPAWNDFKFRYLDDGPLAADVEAAGEEQTVKYVPMLAAHIQECLGSAWGRHETIGEYMTAALLWLESGGTADMAALAAQHRVQRLAGL